MPEVYQLYNCFVSSPSDVAAERQLAEEAIRRINKNSLETLKLSLNVKKWEDLPPETPNLPEEQIQDVLNKEVEKSHFFILILYKRYGRIAPGYQISNTERELNIILEHFQRSPKLKILAYFRSLAPNEDPGNQEQKLRDFRLRLKELGVLYKEYTSPEEFKEQLTHDLYSVILKMCMSSFKQEALRRFWRLGESDRPTSPRLAIFYPPVNRVYNDPANDPEYWLKRLEPTVYFEDHKAIEKLRKALGILDFHDYRVYPVTNIPPVYQFMNRVWICMPRFRQAASQLQRYEKTARFSFIQGTPNRAPQIIWRCEDGTKVRIASPLGRYLKKQRCSMDISGDYTHQLGRIVAKDFAILARLSDPESADRTAGPTLLQDYFIGGIRGLGTWGTGWFIDRKYKTFMNMSEYDDIQMLLEVTYLNYRIFDVVDVSRESAAYFRHENAAATIRKNIKNFCD